MKSFYSSQTKYLPFFLLLLCWAWSPRISAQTLEICNDRNDVSEMEDFQFYPFERVDSLPLESISDTLLFDSVPGFMIITLEEYDIYYIPVPNPEGSSSSFYQLNWFSPLDEASLLKDEELGDLVVLYGYDRNGRSSARYGSGWGSESNYFTLIDLKRGGYYGQYQYLHANENWGVSYTDTIGNEIYHSDLMDTATDPNFHPSDHFNVHNYNSLEEYRCSLAIGSRSISIDCNYSIRHTATIDYLQGGQGEESEGDSCRMFQKYYRDQDGLFKPTPK